MKVLVTGASGLLGSSVARVLAERGDDVSVFQRRPSGVPSVAELPGDVTDPDAVAAAVTGHDAVVHLAARVAVTGPWSSFASVNIDGTRNVIDAVRAARAARLVYVSSPSVAHHGRALVGAGSDPADPARARGHYSRSKAVGELLALAADDARVAVVAVRPHLVWGPGDTRLIAPILKRAQAGRLALIDHGAALVDSTYVTNAAEAIVAALDRADAVHGRSFVISNGQPRTIAELVTRICQAAGLPAPRLRVPYPLAAVAGDLVGTLWTVLGRDDPPLTRFLAEQLATAHWFDQRQTREVLGWTPRVDLDEGFSRLAAHLRGARPREPRC